MSTGQADEPVDSAAKTAATTAIVDTKRSDQGEASYAVAVLGASGFNGKAVIQRLLLNPRIGQIHTYGRREVKENTHERVQQHIVDMKTPKSLEDDARAALGAHPVSAVFNMMGIGRTSDSHVTKELLMTVDCDLPTAFARAAFATGTQHFAALTAVGADPKSTYSMWTGAKAGGGWYSHVKGLHEQQVTALGFPSGVAFYRPSTILGTDNTPGFLQSVAPFFDAMIPALYASTHNRDITNGMVVRAVQALDSKSPGTVQIIEGDALREHLVVTVPAAQPANTEL